MSFDRPRSYRRPIVIGLGVAVLALAAAGAVFALTKPEDLRRPEPRWDFRVEPAQPPFAGPDLEDPPPKPKPLEGFRWAQYGYSQDRARYLPTREQLHPPFKRRWTWVGHVLLEFPPIIVGNRLFVLKNDAKLVALNRTTGEKVWSRRVGRLAASSPAFGDGRVYVTVLERRGVRAGRVAALRARDGKRLWRRDLPARSESSPIYDDGRLYFGSENGSVYSLRARNGRVAWQFGAGGAVKGALALHDGRVYFGTYGGSVYALRARGGSLVWRSGGGGNFYSSPAVAFGRVYIGSTNGSMYAFSAADGHLSWSRGTGSYVYASPAAAHVPDGKPAVYFGSYGGTFYALDARSGAPLWTHYDGGKISGGATVVGDVVYYSSWGHRDTTALGARTGRVLWRTDRGAFNPVVSDGKTIYLTSLTAIAAYQPRRR
jgi:outer membrane protein assembly factor BamB